MLDNKYNKIYNFPNEMRLDDVEENYTEKSESKNDNTYLYLAGLLLVGVAIYALYRYKNPKQKQGYVNQFDY